MSIQTIQNHPAHAAERPQAPVQAQQADKASSPTCQAENAPAPRYDEYVPEEETERKAIGIYRVEPDGEGSPRAVFDAPNDEPEPKTERCTADTGNVDREIEKLKEEKKRLEQQLRAADDPQKTAELQQRLASLESELAQKDNDAYRRQHTIFS